MDLKKIVLLAIVGLLIVPFSGCTQSPSEHEGEIFPVFENTEHKIFMVVPFDWKIDKNIEVGGVRVLALIKAPEKDDFRANINILLENSQGLDLDGYTQSFKTSVGKQFTQRNFLLRSEGTLTISDFQSRFIEYSYTFDGIDFMAKHYIIMRGEKVFVVTFTSLLEHYTEFATPFEKSIRMFRFLA